MLTGTMVEGVAACTFVPRTLADQAALTDLIFMAEVVDSPEPRSFVLSTTRVFRGSVPERVTIAPPPGEGVSSCEAAPEIGATYVFGFRDLDGVMGQGDVWVRINGNRVEPLSITVPTTDARELIALLDGLPDTATNAAPTRDDRGQAAIVFIGLLLIGAAAVLRSGFARAEATH